MRIKTFNAMLNLILPKWVGGITLWPFGIYFRNLAKSKEVDRNHEKIHWAQQKELWGLLFYLWYFTEWLIKVITPPKGAYKDISFEREAYRNQGNKKYLTVRKRFAWYKLIKK